MWLVQSDDFVPPLQVIKMSSHVITINLPRLLFTSSLLLWHSFFLLVRSAFSLLLKFTYSCSSPSLINNLSLVFFSFPSLCGRNLAVMSPTLTRSSQRWWWSWRPRTSFSSWTWTRTSSRASPTPTLSTLSKSEGFLLVRRSQDLTPTRTARSFHHRLVFCSIWTQHTSI